MTILIIKEKLLFEKWQVFQDYNDKFGEKVTQKYVRLLKNNPKLNVKRENAINHKTKNAVLMKSVIENKFYPIPHTFLYLDPEDKSTLKLRRSQHHLFSKYLFHFPIRNTILLTNSE